MDEPGPNPLFRNLAETLNFSRAASLANISLAALTRAIPKHEEELGGPLVYRDDKDCRLTSLGADIRGEFTAIAEAEKRIRASVGNRVFERRETLNLEAAHRPGRSPRHSPPATPSSSNRPS